MSEPTAQPVWYTEDQAKALVDQAVAAALQAHAATQQPSDSMVNASQVQAIVDEALARQAEAHNKSLQALASALRGSVASLVPEHSGGPGTEIAETWSAYEQEQARKAAAA